MATNRMYVSVSDEIKAWLENESKSSGLPQSTLILIGLKTYIDQQIMLGVVKTNNNQNQTKL